MRCNNNLVVALEAYLSFILACHSFELLPHVLATSHELQKDSSGSHLKYNAHTFTFHVTRKMGFYFWNVFFVTVSEKPFHILYNH